MLNIFINKSIKQIKANNNKKTKNDMETKI